MRELIMDELSSVSGGGGDSATCSNLGDLASGTITASGTTAGIAAAVLIPGAGAVAASLVAALSALAGMVIGNQVEEACKKHEETVKQTAG